jgi:two-component system, NtrC family, response regulator HydG
MKGAGMKDRILLVDDDSNQCELVAALLERLDYAVTSTTSPTEALGLVESGDFDVVLTDVEMPEMSGTDLCSRICAARPDVSVIIVTGVGTMETAVAAMRAGAYDFITKPVDANLVGFAISRAVSHRRLRVEVRQLREASSDAHHGPLEMIGDGPAMRRVTALIERVASSDTTVLVQGETGTGKELVARALHGRSSRASGPFVAINCAAVPGTLLESELFGHARGAFTDAKTSREGLFVQANKGTLFLDEIGDMPMDMQAKLLRALQERTVRPVGSDREVPFDTRIIAATHRDLEAQVAEKTFREDLYYRINVVRIEVPPLRARTEDILPLTTHFLGKAAERDGRPPIGLSPEVAKVLLDYEWPGNVRELENCVERATALARDGHVVPADLPERIRSFRPADSLPAGEMASDEILPLDEVERRYILRALKILNGNGVRAAQLLRVDRRTLSRRLKKYAVEAAAAASPSESMPLTH